MPAQLSRHQIARQKHRRRVVVRRRRVRFLALFLASILAVSVYTVTKLADRSTAQVTGTELLVTEASAATGPVDPEGPTFPVFARLNDRNLVLPIAARSATIIAYHPLGDERAAALIPTGVQTNDGVVSRTISRVFSGSSSIEYYVLKNEGRTQDDTGSVDIGAPAGTPIVSPVSGVVTGVTEYLLYGKYVDVQIDIAPDGISDVTLSLLFVDQPAVTIGQTVEEGKTQLGKVREPEGDLGARIAEYTHDSGSHVHLQVTRGMLD